MEIAGIFVLLACAMVVAVCVGNGNADGDIVVFESGKFGIRRWNLFPFHYEYLSTNGPDEVLEFHWWHDIGGHSPSIRAKCEFESREAAQEKLDRWIAYKNRPSSAINDKGRSL
jgi:hypothetical protein